MAIEIWIKFSAKDKFRLPVNPATISVSSPYGS